MASVPRSEWTDFEPPDSGCSDEEEPVAAKHSASTSEQSSSHAAERQAATPEPVPRKRQRLALQEDLFRLDDDENDGSDEPVRILAADEQSAAELEGVSGWRHVPPQRRFLTTPFRSWATTSSPMMMSSRRSSEGTSKKCGLRARHTCIET